MKIKSIAVYVVGLLFVTTSFAQTFTVGSFNLRYDNPRDSGNLWIDRLDLS